MKLYCVTQWWANSITCKNFKDLDAFDEPNKNECYSHLKEGWVRHNGARYNTDQKLGQQALLISVGIKKRQDRTAGGNRGGTVQL